jgi:beta-lactamase class A
MMRMLAKNYWDENEAISQIPPTIAVFSKNGCVNKTRNEAMIVNAPKNPYVFCIFTKNNKDISWTHDNEAWTLARKVSKLLWDILELSHSFRFFGSYFYKKSRNNKYK